MNKILKPFVLILSFLVLFASSQGQIREEFQRLYGEAYQAYQMGKYEASLNTDFRILKLMPCHPIIIYNVSCMYSLLGNKDEAIKWLNRYLDMGNGFNLDLNAESDFDTIRESEEFRKCLSRMENLHKPVNQCNESFRIAEKDLLPEGIAYDISNNRLFLGSTYKGKIIQIDKKGRISDFASEGQDSLRSVLGMIVDQDRKYLWVLSAVNGPRMKKFVQSEMGKSCVFKYDLKTGRLIKKYRAPEDGSAHGFNDITVNSVGDVYITDSRTGNIYLISLKNDNLELFFDQGDFAYLNGITISPDDQILYISDLGNQIYTIDIPAKSINALNLPENITTYGIDGLKYYKNTLFAVQNQMNRISRFFLDETGTKVLRQETIESNNPLFQQIPTTGVIAKNNYYFIANSQLRSFDRTNVILPEDQLQETIIMKYEIPK